MLVIQKKKSMSMSMHHLSGQSACVFIAWSCANQQPCLTQKSSCNMYHVISMWNPCLIRRRLLVGEWIWRQWRHAHAYSRIAWEQVYKFPVTCVPCGHNYCRKCIQNDESSTTTKYTCKECGEADTIVANDVLETLCSKYEYTLGMVRNIHKICAQ